MTEADVTERVFLEKSVLFLRMLMADIFAFKFRNVDDVGRLLIYLLADILYIPSIFCPVVNLSFCAVLTITISVLLPHKHAFLFSVCMDC